MKRVNAGYEILTPIDRSEFLKTIERAGRTCYKSEDKITEDSASKFVRMLVKRNHHAMLEHAPSISIKFICDRGVSHEIVRYRLFSFAQESTRYVNYSGKEMEFIKPCFWDSDNNGELYLEWYMLCVEAERVYKQMIEWGAKPEQARSVLPNSLKTEIIVTGNVREWMHFFKVRIASAAHPQMREIAEPLQEELRELLPEIFDGIAVQDT